MCELLGISCSSKIRPRRYLAAFRRRGKEFAGGGGNPDGWGIALYPDGKGVQLIKEPLPAASSKLSEFVASYEHLRSMIFVAHVRKASRGAVVYRNTHPFCREAMGHEYSLAHNGTLRNARMLPGGRFNPVGSTDSERLFCSILDHIEKNAIRDWSERELNGLRDFLLTVNRRPTKDATKPNKVNLLLSDGATLFCYNDFFGRGTLHRLMIPRSENPPAGSAASDHVGGNEEIPKRSLAIVATKPLNKDPGWVAMPHGELCAFRNGVMVFSSSAESTGIKKQSKK